MLGPSLSAGGPTDSKMVQIEGRGGSVGEMVIAPSFSEAENEA